MTSAAPRTKVFDADPCWRKTGGRRTALHHKDDRYFISRRESLMQQDHDSRNIRNPFGTMDVPGPYDQEVMDYAGRVTLAGDARDSNAMQWASISEPSDPLDGTWASRWNGGVDPTIPGDAPDKWKQGRAEVRGAGDRIYLRFDWDGGRRHGLIEARRDGEKSLVGKYINLTDPKITRPWLGIVVDAKRIDGRFPEGRLDFRRWSARRVRTSARRRTRYRRG